MRYNMLRQRRKAAAGSEDSMHNDTFSHAKGDTEKNDGRFLPEEERHRNGHKSGLCGMHESGEQNSHRKEFLK